MHMQQHEQNIFCPRTLKYCIKKGIEAKIHYPIPIYRQPAMNYLKHKMPKRRAKIYSVLIVTGAGITKEIIDEKWRKGYELSDITANSFGISFALLTIDF